MIIEEEDFRLIPIDDSTFLFNLELIYIIKPRGKESRKEFKNSGYGIPLDYAIKKICEYRVEKKHKDQAITLIEYFTDFKNELSKFSYLLLYYSVIKILKLSILRSNRFLF